MSIINCIKFYKTDYLLLVKAFLEKTKLWNEIRKNQNFMNGAFVCISNITVNYRFIRG